MRRDALIPDDGRTGARRLRLEIRGLVQGVGFRPFVYRLARDLGLAGWVANDGRGVIIEVEGAPGALEAMRRRVVADAPPRARIDGIDGTLLDLAGLAEFSIRTSRGGEAPTVPVLPDAAPCAACLAEVRDPADRRHRYPFTNCTHCGPRFTIVRALPYDRPNTTMAGFPLCPDCRREYHDPADRRFHAQPLACPACGPRLALWGPEGEIVALDDEALEGAARDVLAGRIVALKGLGGFQLLVDARSDEAVACLRVRKQRDEKPLAVMVADLAAARSFCAVSGRAALALTGPETPIVLVPRRAACGIAASVAPGNPRLGLMLPATPLHHLLLDRLGIPIVCTSGNLSDEPICIDERDALRRLRGIADAFLIHDRPIARHADDSVVHEARGAVRLVRRARGYAPAPVPVGRALPTILAVGAHQKSTVALAVGERIFVSQHVGDLDTLKAFEAFERVIADFLALWDARPEAIAHDLHPDYASTRWALDAGFAPLASLPRIGVQHHHAHLAACLAENGVDGPALGVVWDGAGYGPDGTIWGGEFLAGSAEGYRRVAHLRPFLLPGGDAAAREPRRSALAVLWDLWGERGLAAADLAPVRAFGDAERGALATMLRGAIRSPRTTSAGRLFDAVASIAGLRQKSAFEAQAAMDLEFAVDVSAAGAYPVVVADGDPMVLDWRPAIEAVVADVRRGTPAGVVAARFHAGLVDGAVAVAARAGLERVALTGGCFQNTILLERLARRLEEAGHEVILHRQLPANDGGVSLGQAAVAAARWTGGRESGDVSRRTG